MKTFTCKGYGNDNLSREGIVISQNEERVKIELFYLEDYFTLNLNNPVILNLERKYIKGAKFYE